MPLEPPSGRQFAIRYATQRAAVTEVGATLREYAVDDEHVIDGFQEHEMVDDGRGQPLLPWPNRLADGQYTFDGQQLQLPINELNRRNASHGLTRWRNWTAVSQSESSVTLSHMLHPRPGYPFTLSLVVDYALGANGLSVRTSAENCGAQALPFGAGFHPYLTIGSPLIDDAVLHLPACRWLPVDERLLPTGAESEVGATDLDFRTPRPIGSQKLDACFTSLERDVDGLVRVALCSASRDRTVALWMDASFQYVQVFTGDTLAPRRQRTGLAVEPMSCPPNAFRSGTGLVRLEPGERWSGAWGISTSLLTNR